MYTVDISRSLEENPWTSPHLGGTNIIFGPPGQFRKRPDEARVSHLHPVVWPEPQRPNVGRNSAGESFPRDRHIKNHHGQLQWCPQRSLWDSETQLTLSSRKEPPAIGHNSLGAEIPKRMTFFACTPHFETSYVLKTYVFLVGFFSEGVDHTSSIHGPHGPRSCCVFCHSNIFPKLSNRVSLEEARGNNNPFTIKTSTVYIAIPHIFHHMYWPHVKNYFQIRFHWFHLHHHFQHIMFRSIDHISWKNADFHHDFRSSIKDVPFFVPVSKALRCFKAVASSCWCGADLCNQGCSSNSLAERRRLGSTFNSRSITSLASWETPSQSSME